MAGIKRTACPVDEAVRDSDDKMMLSDHPDASEGKVDAGSSLSTCLYKVGIGLFQVG